MSESETRQRTARFRAALDYARPSLAVLAQEAGYGESTFDLYDNRRPPTPQATRALADALEERARKLREHAEKLRGVI